MSSVKGNPLAAEAPSAGAVGVQPPVASVVDQAVVEAISRSLYTVRFKAVRGVQEVIISASSPDRAKQVASAWVNSSPGRLLLQVAPVVVADERILKTHEPNPAPPTTGELSRQ